MGRQCDFSLPACPAPGCGLPCRVEPNPHTGRMTFYHGEDAVAALVVVGDLSRLAPADYAAALDLVANQVTARMFAYHTEESI